MNHDEVISRIVEEIKNEGVEFDLDDPFEDPTLVTTAFMDIEWQDEHGNSALMVAAAENRVLQVKGILTSAINKGKLWQLIDMRNTEGLNCVDMAVRSGSEMCAMLITKVAREYAKLRPRPLNEKTFEKGTTKTDVLKGGPSSVELFDENYVKELVRQSSSASGHGLVGKRLSREKIPHNMVPSNHAAGHEYLKMVKRSRSAHSRLLSQRTFSVESESMDSSEPGTPQMPLPPPDHGVFSSVGERIRNIFAKKPPLHSKSTSAMLTDRIPPVRPVPTVNKTLRGYQSTGFTEDVNHVTLPQHSFSDSPTNEGASSSGTSSLWIKDKPTNIVTTQNAVRLPPLNLRRRASSDLRNRNFSSLGEDE